MRPIREWQSRSQWSHLQAVSGWMLIRSLRRLLFSWAWLWISSSPTDSWRRRMLCHTLRYSAMPSQCWQSMPRARMSRLHTSLKRSWGRQTAFLPEASSPYIKSFGIRPIAILRTCPSHRSLRCLSRVCIVRRLAPNRTPLLVVLSLHEMPRMRRRQRS